jgi:uridine kinase
MLFIGITGASSSGKTTLGKKIQEIMGKDNCFIVSQDNFYKGLPDNTNIDNYNFDEPEAIDFDELYKFISKIMNNEEADLPYYDFSCHKVSHIRKIKFRGKCIILEGIFALIDERIKKQMNLKIFVDTDLDTCLIRRLKRDTTKRSRTMDSVLTQYEKYVKPCYYKYITFEKQNCDIVIPSGGENIIAITMIKNYIFDQINTN